MPDARIEHPEAAGSSTVSRPPLEPTRRSNASHSLRSHLPNPSAPVLPPAYLDAEAYLLDNRFHRSLSFRPSFEEDGPAHRLTYAAVGSDEPGAPVLLWVNGLGGNRLAACCLDGICAENGVRLLTIDRPGSGGSTMVPLAQRFSWFRESIVALLAHESITSLSILSHSNGDLYTMNLLGLILDRHPHLTVNEWILSSPFLPPWLSGSLALTAARWLPARATGCLGGLVSTVTKGTGLVSGMLSLSGGLSSGLSGASAGFSAGVANSAGGGIAGLSSGIAAGISQGWAKGAGISQEGEEAEASEAERSEAAGRRYTQFRLRQANKEEHRRVFSGRYIPPEVFTIASKWVLAEGLESLGQEALVCLRKGDGAGWGWGEAEDGSIDEHLLFERGFTALKRKLDREGRSLKMSVWYGEEDGLIPRQGQQYLKTLLVDQLRLVAPDDFHTIPAAGHDHILSLECMVTPLLQSIQSSRRPAR